jgi:signal transduction histidine kinase
MAVVENVSEKQIGKAIWFVPLYLLIINFFVMPIALTGNDLLSSFSVDPDMYVLAIPLALDNSLIASVAVLGGFSAASGMVMVSTHALSKMLSNSVIMPFVIDKPFITRAFKNESQQIPVFFRRLSIILVLVLAFLYHQVSTELLSLVSIGLVSFVAVAQFAPLMFGALFWKLGNKKGAISGLVTGFTLWFFHLVVPTISELGIYPEAFTEWTILGGETSQTAAITQVLFWSLTANTLVYVFVSLLTSQSAVERNQAEIFIDIFRYSKVYESSVVWKGTAYFPDIKSLLERFLGRTQAERELEYFSQKHNIEWKADSKADGRLVTFAEKQLTSVIGSASAKIMVASVVKEERIGLKDVVNILKESQELLRLNKELTRKSSELKRATDALKRANQKLQVNDELKDEFLYTVTHEMRTPLTSIRALSEILVYDRSELPEEMQEQYTATILKESERMSRLISQVLDLENFESGKHKLQLDYLNVTELLEDCIRSMNPVFDKKNIKVLIDIQKGVPTLLGDYDRLTQVVLNLLSNAVKYVPEENGKIRLTAYQIDHNVQVNITDNGKGIPEELQRVIFEKFFQARNQTIRKPKGSGLGLAISKKIVQLHEGQIWVESEPGKGARFSFTIPLKTRY